ncbi:hypothetical protein ACA910_004374 [Epithemia clementina (nom. ined.)]
MINNGYYSPGFGPGASSTASTHQHPPTASISFAAAPAPYLGPDGEIVVDSSAYSTTGSVAPSYYQPPPADAPRRHSVSSTSPYSYQPNDNYNYNNNNNSYPSSASVGMAITPVYPSPIIPPSTPQSAAYSTTTTTNYNSTNYDYGGSGSQTVVSAPLYSSSSPTSAEAYQTHDATSFALVPRDPSEEAREQPENGTGTGMVPYESRAVTTTANGTAAGGPHKTYPNEVLKMKTARKRMTIAAGVTGGIVGLVALGPVGAVIGATGGAMATRSIGKRRERKKREKIANRAIAEQHQGAPDVLVHQGSGVL